MRRTIAALGLGWGLTTGGWALAQLAPPTQPINHGSPSSVALASRSAEALIAGRAADALRLADEAVAADGDNPWARYDRASALAGLGRVDDAVAAFQAAEARFAAADRWGRSVAIFGRGDVLAQVGRCVEARAAFAEYASLVDGVDPRAAENARGRARSCQPATRR